VVRDHRARERAVDTIAGNAGRRCAAFGIIGAAARYG